MYYLHTYETKKAGRDRSSSLSRLLQEQEQCGSPRSRAVCTSPIGTPPPSATAGPGASLCPDIKVARKKHTLGDTSPSLMQMYELQMTSPNLQRCVWPGCSIHLLHTKSSLEENHFDLSAQSSRKNATLCLSKGCLNTSCSSGGKKEDYRFKTYMPGNLVTECLPPIAFLDSHEQTIFCLRLPAAPKQCELNIYRRVTVCLSFNPYSLRSNMSRS